MSIIYCQWNIDDFYFTIKLGPPFTPVYIEAVFFFLLILEGVFSWDCSKMSWKTRWLSPCPYFSTFLADFLLRFLADFLHTKDKWTIEQMLRKKAGEFVWARRILFLVWFSPSLSLSLLSNGFTSIRTVCVCLCRFFADFYSSWINAGCRREFVLAGRILFVGRGEGVQGRGRGRVRADGVPLPPGGAAGGQVQPYHRVRTGSFLSLSVSRSLFSLFFLCLLTFSFRLSLFLSLSLCLSVCLCLSLYVSVPWSLFFSLYIYFYI